MKSINLPLLFFAYEQAQPLSTTDDNDLKTSATYGNQYHELNLHVQKCMKLLHDACAFFTLFKKAAYSLVKGTTLFFLHLRFSLLLKMLSSYVMYRARGRRHFGFGWFD